MGDVSEGIDPPIVVIEGWDFEFYDTVADALSSIEPWYPSWVPEYRAFDRLGRRLELAADPPIVEKRLLFGLFTSDNAHKSSLIIRPVESEPAGRDELVGLLRGYLREVQAGVDPEVLDLDALWAKASSHAK
jgi:hypothetical protein